MQKDRKKISLSSAISIILGCVIGSGVFVKPGRVLEATGDSTMALLAWVIGGLIALTGGLTLAEIASRIPKSGGIYAYIEDLFGKPWAFVSGWVQSTIYGPALSGAISLYFAALVIQFFALPDSMVKPIAIISLVFLSGIISLKTSHGESVSHLINFVKLIPILALGLGGLIFGDQPVFGLELPSTDAPVGLGVAILATFWAYDGWVQVSNLGEHIDNPARNIPKAFLYGLSIVMVVYLLINIALFHVMPVGQIAAENEKASAIAAELLFGSWAGKAISLGIIIAIFGALNGNILTMPMVPFAMARNGLFPFAKFVGAIHPKSLMPVNSIFVKAAISTIMIIFLNVDRITDIAMFIMYICYSAVFLGIFVLRKKYGVPEKGSYKVPLFPLVPLLAGGGSLYVCYSMIIQNPMDGLISLGIALSGLPIYFRLKKAV